MATLITTDDDSCSVDTDRPLTRTAIEQLVGGKPHLVVLPDNDYLFVTLSTEAKRLNSRATDLADGPVVGDALLCTPDEIA